MLLLLCTAGLTTPPVSVCKTVQFNLILYVAIVVSTSRQLTLLLATTGTAGDLLWVDHYMQLACYNLLAIVNMCRQPGTATVATISGVAHV
jgi:hypothetical protein